jgi:hypothetical protein
MTLTPFKSGEQGGELVENVCARRLGLIARELIDQLRMRRYRAIHGSVVNPAYRVASSQFTFSPLATCGRRSVSSIAYQAPLPLRSCSKAWAHCLWRKMTDLGTNTGMGLVLTTTPPVAARPRLAQLNSAQTAQFNPLYF